MSEINRLFQLDKLADAFRALRDKTSKPGRFVAGTDGVTIADYDRNSPSRLRGLAATLKGGKFLFSSLRPVLIRKPNGKDRLICVPTVEDRIVQNALLAWLSDDDRYHLDNGVSYGFIRGQGVRKAAVRAKELRGKHPYVYRTDITSFFDNIPRAHLKNLVRRLVRQSSLHSLLFQVIDCEIENPKGSRKQKRISDLGIRSGHGLRQGMPLSPFFSNVVLAAFDRAVIAANYLMVRYADDLVFFADSADDCRRIDKLCSAELNKLGLKIPQLEPGGKTQIFSPTEPAEFLGVALVPSVNGTYRLEITAKQQEDVKREILRYGNGPEVLARNLTFSRYGRSLESTIAGYRNAYRYCDNFGDFDTELTNWKSAAIERLLKKWLGVAIHKLPPEKRAFFELI